MSKTYIIVGGNQGIGKALFEKLINENTKLITITRNKIAVNHSNHISICADVCDSFPEISTGASSIDGLVYCPGTITLKPFTNIKTNEFIQDFHINVIGLINTLQYCIPLLKNSQSSSVIAFSTIASCIGMSYHSSVACSKSAIEGLMKSLAAEYASHKIRFNVIAPSIVDTPLASGILNTDAKRAEIAKKHPLKKIGDAQELAELTYFLLSDSSSWITGQVIHADGGLSSISKI